jgi:ubiquinone/menaquinone biosynthesis C-methylase UbiE
MPEMSRLEKYFVNRRGTRAYGRMLDRLERAGPLPLAPASQVLELGAGNGALSLLVLERYHPGKVWVTDYDPEQLAVARKRLEARLGTLPDTIVIERADGTHLAYADSTFDLVIAHYVLHHFGPVPDILRGVDEIQRVLRPGGRLLYAEMFHRDPIREHLAERGFTIAFRERRRRLFATVDIIMARAPSNGPVPS